MTFDDVAVLETPDGIREVRGKWCGSVFYLETGGALVADGRTEHKPELMKAVPESVLVGTGRSGWLRRLLGRFGW